MSSLGVYDMSGNRVGDFDVPDSLLQLKKGGQAVHDVVVATLAARRAGTASTLRKGEVAGSNRKPWRQKGTGRARAGYRQSPLWRGGGVVFGPHPRSYSVKVNKKVARLAFRRAFSEKLAAGDVLILDELALPEPKTKLFALLLASLKITPPAVFVVNDINRNAAMASRNIPNIEIVRAGDMSVYQLVRYRKVVATRAALETIKSRLGAEAKRTRQEAVPDENNGGEEAG